MIELQEKLSWDEIVEKYPDRWVALTDYDMDGVTILAGRVCAVCKDTDRLDEEIRLINEKITFKWRRTTDIEGAYVYGTFSFIKGYGKEYTNFERLLF